MSSILSGTAKLAGWTLAAAVVVSALVSSHEGPANLDLLRRILAPSADAPAPPRQTVDPASTPDAPVVNTTPAPQPSGFGDELQLSAGAGGNFHVEADIDGATVPMVVDTGASFVVLSYEQADSLGFHPAASAFRWVSQTANGRSSFAKVTLPFIRLGSIEVDDVPAAIGSPGAIGGEGLLGMTFLDRLRSYQVTDGSLILKN
jgi:aspartyl protease family protein